MIKLRFILNEQKSINEKTKNIEIVRFNDLGNSVLSIIYQKDQIMVPYLSDYFFNKACMDFVTELHKLENRANTITAFNSLLTLVSHMGI